MKKIIKIIANIYLVCFAIFWLICMVGIFITRGFTGIQETLSPFNIANYLVIILSLSPYFILITISDKIK